MTATNTGARAGEDVVQVYARDEVASVGVSVRRLVDFARIAAAAGKSVQLTFTIPSGRLGFHDASMRLVVEPEIALLDPNKVPAFSVATTVTA